MIKRRQIIKNRLKNNGGFTLIEVIAVLIILAIVTAVAVTRGMSTQNDLIPQADTVKTHLRFAQLKALGDDVNTWGITFTTGSYSLSCTAGTNSTCPSSQLPSEMSSSHSFPSHVTATSTTVNFDSWGSPGTADVPIVLSENGNTTTVTVKAYTGYITP